MRRKVLQPNVARCNRRAQARHHKSREAINHAAAARWPMQRRQQEHCRQKIKGHTLHHAQRAGILHFNVLQVIGNAQEASANSEARGKS